MWWVKIRGSFQAAFRCSHFLVGKKCILNSNCASRFWYHNLPGFPGLSNPRLWPSRSLHLVELGDPPEPCTVERVMLECFKYHMTIYVLQKGIPVYNHICTYIWYIYIWFKDGHCVTFQLVLAQFLLWSTWPRTLLGLGRVMNWWG